MAKPLIYTFGVGSPKYAELPSKEEVGGKGANLIEMANLGLPVPPGAVIVTSECNLHLGTGLTPALRKQQLEQLARQVIRHFEDNVKPALGYMPLVSVRSGARVSMPGMMDTLLNVGIAVDNYEWWEQQLGKACLAECATRLNSTYQQLVGVSTPPTFQEQLEGAIGAVFRSWNSERAKEYRRLHGYPDNWGTAVTVQAMVFGNVNTESCSGVLFTRDPATGENAVTGEFLPQAQGEDVVAGIRTPRPLHLMEQWNEAVLNELLEISGKLEQHYRDMQDIEFTVQSGKLWILQTRNAKRTAEAAFKIAHDLVIEGLIDKAEAVRRVTSAQYHTLLRPRIAEDAVGPPDLTGLSASPGVATGRAVFNAGGLGHEPGQPFILIRKDTSPDDFPAMVQSAAILTSTGGATSHAAVVARGINKPAVVGATSLMIGQDFAQVVRDGKVVCKINAGDTVTVDGATGRVWVRSTVPVLGGAVPTEALALVEWAAQVRNALMVYTVSDPTVLPESGRYYLSVASLSKATQFRALFKALAQRPELHGVVGFERPVRAVGPEDQEYLALLALNPKAPATPDAEVSALVKALAAALLPKKLKKRWLIHMPMTVTGAQIQCATEAGWSLVRPVRTLADLLAATGPVVFSQDFRERMKGESVQLDEILTVLAKAGRAVTELGGLADEKDFVNEVLGK